jgi:ferredoxin
MVDAVKRSPTDLFGWPLLGLLFKHRKALLLVRTFVMFLFLSALYFGFSHPALQENPYTTAVFWSLFWPFFMIVSLVLIGPAFCGVCPHGVMGRWLNGKGLHKEMPAWLRRRGIGLGILITLYWVPLYLFPGLLKTPWIASLLFLVLTLVAAASFYLYKNMAYCTYLCPIGAVTKSFGKMGMVRLQTYQSECGSCRTFDCAKACDSNLQPFQFEKKNSMRDCTLCMECALSCEAVSFSLVKPSSGLFGTIKDKSSSAHTWVYVLLLAVITITMRYHHGLGHSPLKEQLPWAHAGHYLQSFFPVGIDWVGFSALAMALASVALFVLGGFKLASMVLRQPFGTFLHTASYALAPLMLIGSLSHVGSFFFLHYYSDLANAFYWLIGSDVHIAPLATFKDRWVHLFGLLGYVGALWSLLILTSRIRMNEGTAGAKALAWLFSSTIVWFYLGLLILQQFAMRMGHH